MTIKHLVLSGGGANIFIFYGIIKHLLKQKYIDIKNIESIHATSCGSMIALMLMLDVPLDDMDNYLINRPWEKIFSIKPKDLFNAYNSRGIIGHKWFVEIFKSLMEMNDIPLNITLKEFYEKNNINFHIYATEFEDFIYADLNHETFPNLELLKAIQMSSSIPVLFEPVEYENKLYFDGGLYKNYPLQDCIESLEDVNIDELFGIKCVVKNTNDEKEKESKELDLFLYLFKLANKLIGTASKVILNTNDNIINQIDITSSMVDFNFWKKLISQSEYRKEIIDYGVQLAENYMLTKNDK